MSHALLFVVTLIYFGVAVGFAVDKKYDWCVVFIGYAVSNLALMAASR